jgi:hypothetical protein
LPKFHFKIVAKMATEFEFKQWCEEYELEQDTVTLLQSKGFKSYKSLVHLDEDILKKDFKALVPGQLVLLREGVSILRPDTSPARAVTTATQPAADGELSTSNSQPTAPSTATPQLPADQQAQPSTAADLLAMWSSLAGINGTPETSATAQPGPADPFGFGPGVHKGKKLHKITDYITNMLAMDPSYEEDPQVEIGGVKFCVSGGKRIAHDKVRVEHYMEGALRVLRQLIMEEDMNKTGIVNHINYLIQIACYAQSKRWISVMSYDTIYRREQHQHGFTWGSQSPFLISTLVPKYDTNQPHTPSTMKEGKKPQTFVNPKTKNPVCGRWNGRPGCTGVGCNFDHVCKICFSEEHTSTQHWERGLATPQPKNY